MLTIDMKRLPKDDAHGAAARYWRLGDHFGMKAYAEEGHRDEGYLLQKYLAKHGGAVPVVGRFNIRLATKPTLYALVTEHVPILGDQVRRDFNAGTYARLHRQLGDLVFKLFKSQWEDSHHFNWGLAKADLGSPVIIDFSYHSFGGKSKAKAEQGCKNEVSFNLQGPELKRFVSLGLAEGLCRKANVIGKDETFLAKEALAAFPGLAVDPVIVACAKGQWMCPPGWAEAAPARKLRIKR